MNSVITVSLINCLIWILFAYYISRKRKDSLHIANIFILLFVLTYPIKLILTELGFSILDSSLYGADWQIYALFIANVSAFLFVCGALLSSRKALSFNVNDVQSINQEKPGKIPWGWFAFFMVLLVSAYGVGPFANVFSQALLLDFMSIKSDFRTNRALAALCTQGYLVCLILFMNKVIYAKHNFLSIALQVSLWTFMSYLLISLTGSKYTALLPLASYFLLVNTKRVKNLKPLAFPKMLLLGLGGIIMLMLFAYLRGFGSFQDESFSEIIYTAFVQFTYAFDGPDNLTIILYRLSDFWFGDLNFAPTIQNVFISPIPRFLWPDKPEVLSNLFIMKEYLFERYTDHLGEVISPSMAGENDPVGGICLYDNLFFVFRICLWLLLQTSYEYTKYKSCFCSLYLPRTECV